MPRETFKDIFVVELQVCPHAICGWVHDPGGLYKELDFLWLYLVNPGTLRKCMSTYALIVVTVISLLFSSSSIVAGIVSKKNHLPAFLDKIKVYKRDGLKNHHNHSKSSRYTYCYCIFFSLFAITTNTLFLQTISFVSGCR